MLRTHAAAVSVLLGDLAGGRNYNSAQLEKHTVFQCPDIAQAKEGLAYF